MGRKSIDPKLKLEAVEYYLKHRKRGPGRDGESMRSVAKKFGVSYVALFHWIKQQVPKMPGNVDLEDLPVQTMKRAMETDHLFLARDVLGYKWDDYTKEGIRNPPDEVHVEMKKLLNETARFLLGLFPRFTYKTTLLTITDTIQEILKNPKHTDMIAADPLQKAAAILVEITQKLEHNDVLIKCYGKFKPKERGWWNKRYIYTRQRLESGDVSLKDPTINTCGVDSDVTGKHPKKIHVSDIVHPLNITTYEQMQKIINFLRRLIHLAGPHGRMMIEGTPWNFDDAYEYARKKWSDRLEPDGNPLFARKIMDLEKKDGTSIMPSKYTPEYIKLLKEITPVGEYACLYRCNPMEGEGMTLIKLEDLERSQYQQFKFETAGDYDVYIAVDPGISQRAKQCYTGITVGIPVMPYDLYVDEAIKERFDPDQVIRKLIDLCRRPHYRDHVRQIAIESVAFQRIYKGSLEKMLRKADIGGVRVKEIEPDDSKDRRIYSLEPFFRHLQIHLRENLRDLIYQVSHYPHIGEHNRDLLDSLAYLVKSLPHTFMVNPTGIIEVADHLVKKPEEPFVSKYEIAGYDVPASRSLSPTW